MTRRINMIILYHILFVLGLIAYAISLYFFNTNNGEIFSDIGNGVMLIDAVLILLHLVRKKKQ